MAWAALPKARRLTRVAICADVFGVEGTPIPLKHGFVLTMTWFGHGFEKLVEPRWATDFLGRCAALAIDELGITSRWISGLDLLHHDAVPTVIAKIMGVIEASGVAFDELCETDVPGVAGWRVHIVEIEAEAGGGHADVEAEQTIVLEQYDARGGKVQRLENVCEGEFDSPLDSGVDVVECGANPSNLVGHAATLTRSCSAVQFEGMSSS